MYNRFIAGAVVLVGLGGLVLRWLVERTYASMPKRQSCNHGPLQCVKCGLKFYPGETRN